MPPVPTDLLLSPSFSSSLSLCSCDGHTDAITRRSPPNAKASSALCLLEYGQPTSHNEQQKRLLRQKKSWPILSETKTLDDLDSSNLPTLSDPCVDRIAHRSSESQAVTDESLEGWSENVQTLILETDEAFKAVGSAVAEAKASSPNCDEPDISAPSPVIRRHSKPMPFKTGLTIDPRAKDTMPLPPLRSPARNASVKKPKKKASKMPRYGAGRAVKSPLRVPKWALSENMAEILTGQRFRKIEADEMLTSDRIEELRQIREAARLNEEDMQARKSSESAQSMKSVKEEADIENQILEARLLEVENDGNKTSIDAMLSTVPSDRDVIHHDFSVEPENDKKESRSNDSETCGILQPKTAALPSLPAKKRGKPLTKGVQKDMPTIPELMVVTPNNTQLKPATNKQSRSKRILKPEEDDEFFYFKSTPYTFTNPSFRHGPIIFSKAEVGISAKTMDDTLDWTAFQMAILGGAGDLFPDTSVEEDRQQADDIASWFDSYGFETYGKLIGMNSRDSARSLRSSSTSTIDTETEPENEPEPPIAVGTEFSSGFWNVTSTKPSLRAMKFYNKTGLRRWIMDDRSKRLTVQSCESLPPSPMMPLVIDDGGEVQEAVPMGYNLGHDLGDFLKWEAENTYAGGYYG